jgi:TRAP transporter TAXI family solute receptor
MRPFLLFVLLFVLLLVLAGCSYGPDPAMLRRDVEARLAMALPAGSVSVASFTRRGSQKDLDAPPGETRRVIYYDIELQVRQPTDFGAWDAPGVAGLVSALGAGPKGLTGMEAGGNEAGDVISAHGTAVYREEGDTWVAVAPAGFRPAEAPAYATAGSGSVTRDLLAAMGRVVDAVPQAASREQRAVIEEELSAAYAAIRSRMARTTDGYAIAAGPENGQYLRFAQALAVGRDSPRIIPLVTPGGEENLELLRTRKVSLALSQADAALQAYTGAGAFQSRGAAPALRAIGSLYPEPVHVLVRGGDGLDSVAQLRGRRVAIGRPGSASRSTALRVLAAHGLTLADFQPQELSLTDALRAMQRQEVDAVVQVIGVPADSIRDAFHSVPLRVLPLSERAVATLTQPGGGLFAYSIPAGTYPLLAAAVPTVATAAVLLAGADLTEAEVTAITRLVYEQGRDLAARGSAQGLQVSAATARTGLTVPLHVAADRALAAASQAR